MKFSVNGKEISKEIYDALYQQNLINMEGVKPEEVAEQTKNAIIERNLITAGADKEIPALTDDKVEEEYTKLMQQHGGEESFLKRYQMKEDRIPDVKKDIATNYRITQFFDKLTEEVEQPSEDSIKEYFSNNEDTFITPEQVHAKHILRPIKDANPTMLYEEIKGLRKKLLDGEDIEKMATDLGEGMMGKCDLGLFPRGKTIPEFEVVVFSMNVGEISPVFQTKFGFHIATVVDKKDPEKRDFESCQEEIKNHLLYEAKNVIIKKWVDDEKSQADIVFEADPPEEVKK